MDEVTLEDMGPAAATVVQEQWGRHMRVSLTRAQIIALAAGRDVTVDDIDEPLGGGDPVPRDIVGITVSAV